MSQVMKSMLVATWIWDIEVVVFETVETFFEPAGKRFNTPAPPFVAYAHQRLDSFS